MLWIPVFALVIWLLDRTQADIATLVLATHGRKCVTDGKTPRITGRLALAIAACYWTDHYVLGLIALLFSAIQYVGEFWYQQEEFVTIDRSTKKQPKKTEFIAGAISTTRSGWANDPRLLSRIPQFLSTRVLTAMTLLEIVVLLVVCWWAPAYGSLALSFATLGHNLTDSLDGAVGRFRNEGYVLWGYYADHSLDTLYECACMLALWWLSDNDLMLVGPVAMALTVHAFHRKELIYYERKLATSYTNILGGVPLYYIEWTAGALGVFLFFFPQPWHLVAGVIDAIVIISAARLGFWHLQYHRGIVVKD